MDTPKITFTKKPDFTVYKIGELLEFYSRKCELISEEEYQLVTVKRRNEGIVSRGKFKGKKIKTPTQFYIKTGDFLISKRQIVHGACEIVPYQFDNAIVSNEYTVVKGKQGLLITEYFNLLSKTSFMKKHYFLSSYGVDIEKMVFNVEDWKKRTIYLPSIEEQWKVVEFFSSLNKKIQFQQSKINLLKEQKIGFMQKLFNQEIRFKDENGEEYPEWRKKVRSDELFEAISNKNHDGNLPVLSATQNQGMVLRDLLNKDMQYSTNNLSSYKITEINDFVISLRSFQGGIELSQLKGLVSPAYTIFRSKDKDIYNGYFKYFFKTQTFINHLKTATYGIRDGKSISYKDFSTLRFDIPSYDEQKKIACFLSELDNSIQLEQQKLEDLQEQKKGFMQQIFISKMDQ